MLAEAGLRDLHVVAMTGSLDVEMLVCAGAVRAVSSCYVGLGRYGRASAFSEAASVGSIEDRELSEWMLVGGLRAAAMGVPFLPTHAALGSDLVAARNLRTVRDPYKGEELLAVPALRPDVAFLHAWRADEDGNVQLPWPPDHLWDVDIQLARAAKAVVVSVEEVVAPEVVAANPERTRLFGFEVAYVVEAPGGAWPSSLPPVYDEDVDWLREQAGDVGRALLRHPSPWVKTR